jgi:hypothetical protein
MACSETLNGRFSTRSFTTLDPDVDALVVVTPVPIVAQDPNGQTQFLIGRRTDDVELFKRGDAEALSKLKDVKGDLGDLIQAAVGGWLASRFGAQANLGQFHLKDIDDVRDQWSNHFCQAEQDLLIRSASQATRVNRFANQPRGLIFVGGDLHSAATFDVEVADLSLTVPCLITSGIGKQNSSSDPLLGVLVDQNFTVASGIHARLREFINGYNFGVVQIISTGVTPRIVGAIAHSGNSFAWGLKVNVGVP